MIYIVNIEICRPFSEFDISPNGEIFELNDLIEISRDEEYRIITINPLFVGNVNFPVYKFNIYGSTICTNRLMAMACYHASEVNIEGRPFDQLHNLKSSSLDELERHIWHEIWTSLTEADKVNLAARSQQLVREQRAALSALKALTYRLRNIPPHSQWATDILGDLQLMSALTPQ